METKTTKTRKSQARAIYSRRVSRQTFLERTVALNVTLGTAKVWWQQFKVAKATKPAAKSKGSKVGRTRDLEQLAA